MVLVPASYYLLVCPCINAASSAGCAFICAPEYFEEGRSSVEPRSLRPFTRFLHGDADVSPTQSVVRLLTPPLRQGKGPTRRSLLVCKRADSRYFGHYVVGGLAGSLGIAESTSVYELKLQICRGG